MSPINATPKNKLHRYAFWVFVAIAVIFLWAEHRVHVIEYLPLSLLFLCVGMHFFMHRSHGHNAGSNSSEDHGGRETDGVEDSKENLENDSGKPSP